MQQLFPPPFHDLPVEEVYRDLAFPEPPVDRPYVILNFVQTIDGQTTLGNRGAAGLGSSIDHRLMQRLRMTADALLHGAGTVRKDNFPPRVAADLEPERLARGLTRQTYGVVVTGTGDLSPTNRYFSQPGTVIVVPSVHARRLGSEFGDRARILPSGEEEVDLRAALRVLRTELNARVLLCEGGPKLTYALVAQGLLDEIFLTIAPKLAADAAALRLLDGPPFPIDALPGADLQHLLLHGSELFLRYRLSAFMEKDSCMPSSSKNPADRMPSSSA